ncbi:TPA: tRNA preQ1(34) S-adenosylmethionine ribosyltransferase-isomerase QueA [Candidatus Galligastranaerophilus intestinigallinarum]|nr:tRNA preQ1(34) S-adenosylmethionine ribosyltransferase-isomerase QueA [Candidatus Galligastranaerophilus intestinigallinarum]
MTTNLTLDDFNYNLPEELIAKYPTEKRDEAKMLVVDKITGDMVHKHFYDFIDYLNPDDVLILNNTKVIPARLLGKKETGANIEIFLTRYLGNNDWQAIIRNSKRLKDGDIVTISDILKVLIKKKGEANNDGNIPEHLVELIYSNGSMEEILNKTGKIPLPPYIQREVEEKDKEDYQTVYAKVSGSVAAPTAGLHFTSEILEKIEKKGIKIAYVTLNVGLGTFLPVKTNDINNHKMHTESYFIPKETADIINNKKGSLVAIGTTSLRCLEANFKKYGKIKEGYDETDIFIYPPYNFKVVDKLLTNFHLPKSTLLMLVSAFSSREIILSAYNEAIKNNYRFFSYGDCTFLK